MPFCHAFLIVHHRDSHSHLLTSVSPYYVSSSKNVFMCLQVCVSYHIITYNYLLVYMVFPITVTMPLDRRQFPNLYLCICAKVLVCFFFFCFVGHINCTPFALHFLTDRLHQFYYLDFTFSISICLEHFISYFTKYVIACKFSLLLTYV